MILNRISESVWVSDCGYYLCERRGCPGKWYWTAEFVRNGDISRCTISGRELLETVNETLEDAVAIFTEHKKNRHMVA